MPRRVASRALQVMACQALSREVSLALGWRQLRQSVDLKQLRGLLSQLRQRMCP
jgi:hypothetical protein